MQIQIDLFQVLVTCVFFILWLGRLEFMSGQNKKDIALLWEKHDNLSEKLSEEMKGVMTQLSAINTSLARIEGRLSIEKE